MQHYLGPQTSCFLLHVDGLLVVCRSFDLLVCWLAQDCVLLAVRVTMVVNLSAAAVTVLVLWFGCIQKYLIP